MKFVSTVKSKYVIAGALDADIAKIRDLLSGVKMDKFAQAYFDKLDVAAKHGKEGLQSQVAYLLSNLEGKLKPEVEKKLLNYADTGELG